MLRNLLNVIHDAAYLTKADGVRAFMRPIAALPEPAIQWQEYSDPCVLATEDGDKYVVYGEDVRLRFADRAWVQDAPSRAPVSFQASHWCLRSDLKL
jgi:hypothetical protein